jgi:ribosomal protein L21E
VEVIYEKEYKMKFKKGDDVIIKRGSVLSFGNSRSHDYSGARGTILGLNNTNDGYVVRFDKKTINKFPADHMRFIRDNYSHDDRAIFYDRHLDLYIKTWKDNLKDSWCV